MTFITHFWIFRSLSNPLLHRHVHLRNPTFPFGSVHWTISWRWRHVCHRTDLSHFQGRWILGHCYGFPWMRLLCHYCGLDNVLYLEPALQHWQWSSMGWLCQRKYVYKSKSWPERPRFNSTFWFLDGTWAGIDCYNPDTEKWNESAANLVHHLSVNETMPPVESYWK